MIALSTGCGRERLVIQGRFESGGGVGGNNEFSDVQLSLDHLDCALLLLTVAELAQAAPAFGTGEEAAEIILLIPWSESKLPGRAVVVVAAQRKQK